MGSWSLAAQRNGRADLRGEHMSRGTTVHNFTTQVRLPTSAHIFPLTDGLLCSAFHADAHRRASL